MGNLSLRLYPEKLLFTLLNQYYHELDKLDSKSSDVDSVKSFRKDTMVTIKFIEKTLVDRFKDSNMTLKEIANKLLNAQEHETAVYNRLFVERVLGNQPELIDISLLEKVINILDVEDLYSIMEKKKDTIYGDLANNRYQEMMFEVEKDVEDSLEKKKAKDQKLNIIDDIIQEKRERAHKPYTESPFTDEDTISIEKYITRFLGIELDGSSISHSDLKQLDNKFIKTIDNTFADNNEDYVHNNYLLLVKDKFGKRRTYINPEYLDKILDLKISKDALKVQSNNMGEGFSKLFEAYNEYTRLFNENRAFEDINEELKHEQYLRLDKVLMKERDE